MKKFYMMGVILSLSILTSFVPAKAAQSARQRAYQAWQRAKQRAGKAASFAGRHKGKIATAAVAAAGVAAGAYGLHKFQSRNTPPKMGWYRVVDSKRKKGSFKYIEVTETNLSPPRVSYSTMKIDKDDLEHIVPSPVYANVPLEEFNKKYPNLKFIGIHFEGPWQATSH